MVRDGGRVLCGYLFICYPYCVVSGIWHSISQCGIYINAAFWAGSEAQWLECLPSTDVCMVGCACNSSTGSKGRWKQGVPEVSCNRPDEPDLGSLSSAERTSLNECGGERGKFWRFGEWLCVGLAGQAASEPGHQGFVRAHQPKST